MKPILEIESISKRYNIDANRKPYLSLRETIAAAFKPSVKKEAFLALDNVSFSLQPGDTLGIIGKNGAGKSTLLKILSKITPPTSGRIISRGRIASLLEVGTGFHPELSGRENIYMNGSILGMKRAEINQHFDAIVDFSGVEKFLDTPLKNYSSGMQLRLAFAVAAFLEPEILVIDEVLAVGDSEFQKKCLNKMEDVSKSGRTILFVSHQLSAVDSLCNKSIILHKGKLLKSGSTKSCIESYLAMGEELRSDAKTHEHLVQNLQAANTNGHHAINTGETLLVSGTYTGNASIDKPTLGIVIKNMYNVPVLGINNQTYGVALDVLKAGKQFVIELHHLPLLPGTYDIDLFIGDGFSDKFKFENILSFEVNDRNLFAGGKNPDAKLNPFILHATNWTIR